MGMLDPKDLEKQLQEALKECASLREENERLKKLLGLYREDHPPTSKPIISEPSVAYTSASQITNDSPIGAQIALFRSLFRGREDAYPVRWEGRKGNFGYSPACANEWKRPFCRKPMMKCSHCENRDLKPVTDEVIHGHLLGKHTVGVYPLMSDETCWFLAVDFDKKSWQEDVAIFLRTCKEIGVSIALERSRSGKGGHVWMFFERPISASLARKFVNLGSDFGNSVFSFPAVDQNRNQKFNLFANVLCFRKRSSTYLIASLIVTERQGK